MKTKKLVALFLLFALCLTVIGFGVVGNESVNAATNPVFKVNYNSSIATNSADGGLNITVNTTSATGSVDSSNRIDLNKFAIEFTTLKSGHHFSTLYFKFVNYENENTGFVVTFAQNGENVDIKVYDTLTFIDVDEGTEKALVTIDGVSMTSHYFWLEYEAGVLKVKTKSILDEGTAEYSAFKLLCVNQNTATEEQAELSKANFAWVEESVGNVKPLKEANLQVGVLEQEKTGDDLGTDENGNKINPTASVINILSLSNVYGTQVAGSSTLAVRPVVKCSLKEYRGQIINGTEDIFKHKESSTGEMVLNDAFSYTGDAEDTSDDVYAGLVAELTAAEGQEYVFPFYTIALQTVDHIDATEDKYNSGFDDVQFFAMSKNDESTEFVKNTEDFSKTSTSKVLSEGEGSVYVFTFTVKTGYDTEERYLTFAVKVVSIKDETKPEVNQENFQKWARENTEFFTDRVINAPDSGSYTFPTITREDNEKYDIFRDYIQNNSETAEDWDSNDFTNLEVVVGFKESNATTDYEWSSDTSITFNNIGSFTIAYKVIDQSGNESVIFAFTVEVQDITAPTITMTAANKTKVLEVGDDLEVPTVSRYDNCSGINTNLNDYTVYRLNYDKYPEGYETDSDGKLITDDLVAVEKVKITEGYKMTEDMILLNDDGESKPYFIVVYTATDYSGNVTTGGTFGFISITAKTAADLDKNPVNETLEIILIVVIAILVVAVLVLLFVNPQQKKDDMRVQALVAKEEALAKEEAKQNTQDADKK